MKQTKRKMYEKPESQRLEPECVWHFSWMINSIKAISHHRVSPNQLEQKPLGTPIQKYFLIRQMYHQGTAACRTLQRHRSVLSLSATPLPATAPLSAVHHRPTTSSIQNGSDGGMNTAEPGDGERDAWIQETAGTVKRSIYLNMFLL